MAIKRRRRDAKAPGHIRDGRGHIRKHRPGCCQILRRQLRGRPPCRPPRLRRREARARALADDGALEFGGPRRCERPAFRPPWWCRSLRSANAGRPARLHALDCLDELLHRARQLIKLPDDQRVMRPPGKPAPRPAPAVALRAKLAVSTKILLRPAALSASSCRSSSWSLAGHPGTSIRMAGTFS